VHDKPYTHRFFTIPLSIEVPPLGIRETELPRIIQAYADEAIVALSAPV